MLSYFSNLNKFYQNNYSNSISNFPCTDVIRAVSYFLDPKDLTSLACVSKESQFVADDNIAWKPHVPMEFHAYLQIGEAKKIYKNLFLLHQAQISSNYKYNEKSALCHPILYPYVARGQLNIKEIIVYVHQSEGQSAHNLNQEIIKTLVSKKILTIHQALCLNHFSRNIFLRRDVFDSLISNQFSATDVISAVNKSERKALLNLENEILMQMLSENKLNLLEVISVNESQQKTFSHSIIQKALVTESITPRQVLFYSNKSKKQCFHNLKHEVLLFLLQKGDLSLLDLISLDHSQKHTLSDPHVLKALSHNEVTCQQVLEATRMSKGYSSINMSDHYVLNALEAGHISLLKAISLDYGERKAIENSQRSIFSIFLMG